MRVVTLSDFTLDQQTIARHAHGYKYRADWDEYKAALRDREDRIRSGRRAIWSAARKLRVIRFGNAVVAWLDELRTSRPDAPTTAPVGNADAVWGAGRSGELRVREALSGVLDDRWVGLTGYLNRGGETDLLVVGPTAIVAFEVKNLSGVVYCRGGRWFQDKHDRHGNTVMASVPVKDRNGRSPSRQINEPADQLESFLASRAHRLRVVRAVVVAHASGRLGPVEDPGVDFVGAVSSRDFRERLQGLFTPGAGAPSHRVDQIVALVEQDHAHHARRRGAGDRRGRPGDDSQGVL